MHSQESEDLLIQRAIRRDRAAFAALYDMHVDQAYRHVYYRVSGQMDAEDITQEVFVRAWKAINKYKRTGAPFVAWLLAIARNLIADHHKANKKLLMVGETEANDIVDATAETATEAFLNKDYVKEAVFKLKGLKQKVIIMRFIDDFSYKEIARVLNKSEGAIRVIQHRALSDLRDIMMRSE